LTRLDRVGVQFNGGCAVFQFIGFFHRGERQLSFFANGYEANVQFISHHSPQNKAARIEAGHYIGPHGR